MSSSALTVGVVGAGRVGAVLGAALNAAGHRVVAAAAVSAASRDRAARLLPHAAVLPADEVARAADALLLLAVPDDALGAVVAGLSTTGALRPGQTRAYGPGVIHSTAHPEKAWVIRITGTDLDKLPRYHFRKQDRVLENA